MTATSGGLVAVHAHPDDESLATGALLATWAAAGRPVTVVTCTRGERGEVIGARLAHLEGDGPALAEHRDHELGAALAALGVRDRGYLDTIPGGTDRAVRGLRHGVGRAPAAPGFPTRSRAGAFVGVGLEEAAERLARVIRVPSPRRGRHVRARRRLRPPRPRPHPRGDAVGGRLRRVAARRGLAGVRRARGPVVRPGAPRAPARPAGPARRRGPRGARLAARRPRDSRTLPRSCPRSPSPTTRSRSRSTCSPCATGCWTPCARTSPRSRRSGPIDGDRGPRRLLRPEQPRPGAGPAHGDVPSRDGRLGCRRRLARRRPPGSVTRVQRLSAGAIGSAVAALLLGVLVGTLGTVMHRSIPPWGVVVCLTLAFVAAVTVRAWAGFVALAGYARRPGRHRPGPHPDRPGWRRPRARRPGDRLGVGARLDRVPVVAARPAPRAVRRPAAGAAPRPRSRPTAERRRSRAPLREPSPTRSASAVGRLPAGVAVITLRWRGTLHAMTASAITSVSLEPPMLLFCVHTDARFRDALDDVDTWSVSVLADDQAPHRRLAGLPGPSRDRPARARPAPTGAGRRRGVGRRRRGVVRLPDRLRAPRGRPRRRRRRPCSSPSRGPPVPAVSSTCAGGCTAVR